MEEAAGGDILVRCPLGNNAASECARAIDPSSRQNGEI
jgi:hypothetical protein